jgi:hypothetical protein
MVSQVAPAAPPMVVVFRAGDGRIAHARCRHPLEFHGYRARIELDFYCPRCMEHVTVPDCVLSRIPLGEPSLAA